VEFENLGHMGPVTHPDLVNEAIGQFLERTHHTSSPVDGVRPESNAGALA
jgi:hypothetical protein